MQCSLVEIGRIDISLTYRYMFVYIRQLAIHLRNAVTVKKKVGAVLSKVVTAGMCVSVSDTGCDHWSSLTNSSVL